MVDALGHTEAWRDKPWKQLQRVVFRLQKRIYRASMVPMTRATCTEEPYDSNRITYGSGTAGGGATRLLTVTLNITSFGYSPPRLISTLSLWLFHT